MSSGTLIRGADGSLYFVRDEVLKTCQVTEPEMLKFCEQLVADHGGSFALAKGPVTNALPVVVKDRGQIEAEGKIVGPDLSKAASTVMCPGVMKDGSIAVLPSSVRVLSDRLGLIKELGAETFSKTKLNRF